MPIAAQLKTVVTGTVNGFRDGAEATGLKIDGAGDWSMRALGVVARNPAPTIAIATVLLFTTVRLPLEIFYSSFDVRPEDVGFNSVQVLLQGSAVLLFFFVLFTAALALFGLLISITLLLPYALFSSRIPPRGKKMTARQRIRRGFRRIVRLTPVLMPVLTFAVTIGYLTVFAVQDGGAVKSGAWLIGGLTPWKAEPVVLTWTSDRHPHHLPRSCGSLVYLGEDDDRVVLYDNRHQNTHRINARDVELEFPLDCGESGNHQRRP